MLNETVTENTRPSQLSTVTTEQHPAPIIIYGAPRSGTGYLSSILNQHPDIFISPEARLFIWLDQSLNVLTQKDEALLNVREEFIPYLRSIFPQVIRDFYRQLKRTRYWGDKNPHYAAPEHRGSLQTVAALFPGTRFIHIIRDGRDVVTSILRKGWGDFHTAHDIWKRHVDAGREFGEAQPPGSYFEIRYEDMIQDDVKVAQSLFTFLGIPLHERVVNFCVHQRNVRTPISGPTRDLSEGAAASQWSSYLTPDQQLESLGLLSQHLLKYGYETPEPFAATCRDRVKSDSVEEVSPSLSICSHPIHLEHFPRNDGTRCEEEAATISNGVLADILKAPPAFFRDKDGKPVAWTVGREVIDYFVQRVTSDSVTLETGAGVSTVAFAALGARHTSVVPSREVVDRIRDYCNRQRVSLERTNFIIDRSENVLPSASLGELDLVLIDGCHGFPAPFIDWYYSSLALKVGGELLVDGVQIWTGRVLVEYLRAEPEWESVRQLGKTAIFRKLKHVSRVKEWSQQPFVVSDGTNRVQG